VQYCQLSHGNLEMLVLCRCCHLVQHLFTIDRGSVKVKVLFTAGPLYWDGIVEIPSTSTHPFVFPETLKEQPFLSWSGTSSGALTILTRRGICIWYLYMVLEQPKTASLKVIHSTEQVLMEPQEGSTSFYCRYLCGCSLGEHE